MGQSELIAKLASTMQTRATDRMMDGVLDVLIGSESEQLAYLRKISVDVEALINGPFHTAMEFLRLAHNRQRPMARRLQDIEKAKDALMNALGNYSERPGQKSWTEYFIGVCCVLLNDRNDARYWFDRAHATSTPLRVELQKKVDHPDYLGYVAKGVMATGILGVIFAPLAVVGILGGIGHASDDMETWKTRLKLVADFNDAMQKLAQG